MNCAIYAIFFILLILAYLSAPSPAPDYFKERNVRARFTFAFNIARVVYVNGKPVSNVTIPLGIGMITFIGNGSRSAGNPLMVNATVFVNATAWGKKPNNVTIQPDGAFSSPTRLDSHGIAPNVALALGSIQDDVWGGVCEGACQVVYDQGGSFPIRVKIDDRFVTVVGQIQIGSQDVTTSIRTNSLILSLTWAILAFAALELRVDNKRHDPYNCSENCYRV